MSAGRGYQPGFYELSQRVRDPASRRRQAAKIGWALTRHGRRDLKQAVCLDLGCSSGLITAGLAPLFRLTIGLEYDVLALAARGEEARRLVRFVRGDGMRLPLAAGSVDVVICAHVYEHVPSAEKLAAEIYRVLAPGGVVFFSGPNWLFPWEPHHKLPFLHWLPSRLADRYLSLAHGGGQHYYERLRHWWGLRRLLRAFEIQDVTPEVMQTLYEPPLGVFEPLVRAVPLRAWRLLAILFPSFNWILFKPEAGH